MTVRPRQQATARLLLVLALTAIAAGVTRWIGSVPGTPWFVEG